MQKKILSTVTRTALAIAIGTAITAPAIAQDRPPGEAPEMDGDSITIAAGAAYAPSYEGSDDYRVLPGVQARGSISGYNFFTRGLQLHVDAVREEPGDDLDILFGPVVGVRLNRVGGIKDAQVKALGKKNAAVEIGAFAGIRKTGVLTSDYDSLGFRVSYVADVASAHGSYVITPAIEYTMPLSERTLLGFSVSSDYVGNGYASYYYSVDGAGAAASGLSEFDADSGFRNVNFSVLGAQSISGNLLNGVSIFAVGNYGRLLGDFKRSPIVSEAGSPNQWLGAIGIAYSF